MCDGRGGHQEPRPPRTHALPLRDHVPADQEGWWIFVSLESDRHLDSATVTPVALLVFIALVSFQYDGCELHFVYFMLSFTLLSDSDRWPLQTSGHVSGGIDAQLLPLIEVILSQDIADLIPYALQLTGADFFVGYQSIILLTLW